MRPGTGEIPHYHGSILGTQRGERNLWNPLRRPVGKQLDEILADVTGGDHYLKTPVRTRQGHVVYKTQPENPRKRGIKFSIHTDEGGNGETSHEGKHIQVDDHTTGRSFRIKIG